MEPVSRLVFLSFTDLSDTGAHAATGVKKIVPIKYSFTIVSFPMINYPGQFSTEISIDPLFGPITSTSRQLGIFFETSEPKMVG